MNGLIKLTLGFAAGYSLCRALEARAMGITIRQAFQPNILFMLTPLSKLTFPPADTVATTDADALLPPSRNYVPAR